MERLVLKKSLDATIKVIMVKRQIRCKKMRVIPQKSTNYGIKYALLRVIFANDFCVQLCMMKDVYMYHHVKKQIPRNDFVLKYEGNHEHVPG